MTDHYQVITSGLLVDVEDGIVTKAHPYIEWIVGRTWPDRQRYFESKGYTVTKLTEEEYNELHASNHETNSTWQR